MTNCFTACVPRSILQRDMEGKEQPEGGPHFVGKKDELIEAKRSFRTFEGRDVLVIYHEGVFYAMDSYCYREHSCFAAVREGASV